MSGSRVAVQVMDYEGFIRFANAEAIERAALFGTEPTVGRSIFDLVSEKCRDRVERTLASALSGDLHIADLRVDLVEPNGSGRSAVISFARPASAQEGTGHFVMTEVIEKSSDAIWVGSPDMTEIEYVNEAFEKLWGHAATDIYTSRSSFINGVHPDDKEGVAAVIDDQRGEWELEFRVVRPDGSERWIEAQAFESEISPEGTFKRAGICRDVTDRIRAVAKSEEHKEFAVKVDQLAGVVGWEIDVDTGQVLWTDAIADLLEIPEAERFPPDSYFDDYIHPLDQAGVEETFQASRIGDLVDLEYRVLTETGKELHVRSIGVSDMVEGKQVRRWGYLQDITEKKELLLRVERSEEFSSRVRKLARIAGWETDPETLEIEWTDEFTGILEISPDETRSVDDLIDRHVHSEDQKVLRTAVERAFTLGEPYDLLLRMITSNEKAVWVRVIAEPEVKEGVVTRLWGYLQDVTIQTTTEKQLIKSERVMAEAGRMARIGGWEFDGESSIGYWTDALFDIFEMPLSRTPPFDRILDLFHPDDRPVVLAAIENAWEKGEDYDLKVRIITDKGNVRHVHVAGNSVVVDGRTTKIRGVLQDITDEADSQAALAKSEELLAATGQIARVGGWEHSAAAADASWTDALSEIFEMDISDRRSLDSVLDLYHPDDQPTVVAARQNAWENGEEYDLRVRIITGRGHLKHVRVIGHPVVVDGKTTMVRGVIQDITGEVERQAELAKSEDLLAATGRAALIGAWELDAATMEVSWTDTLFDIYGLPKGDDARLFGAIDLYHPDDQPKLRAAIDNGLERGESFDLELRITTPGGTSKSVRALGRPILEGGKTVRLRGSLQDITKQVESQAALEASQMLLAATGRAAQVGGWELDATTMEVRWTESLLDLFEVSDRGKPELFGLIDFYHPDDQPVLRDAVQSGLDDGLSFDLELRVITANGTRKRVRVLGNPAIENGKTVRLWGSIQDVTEQVESREALVSSERLLAETGRTARIGGWELNAETLKVSWTDVLFDIFEIPRGDPELFGAIDIYHPDDQPIIRAAVMNGLENGESFDLELRLTTGKGTLRTVRVWGRPVIEGGKTVRLWGSVQDITARVLSEAALAKSENRMRTILDTAPNSFILLDESGVVELWNESSEEMFGFTADEAMGRRLSTLIIPERFRSAHDEGIERFTITGEGPVLGSTLDLFAVRSDGSEFPIELTTEKIEEGGRLHTLGSIRDITERVEHATKIRQVFAETINAMNNTIKIGDPYTADHQRRVAQLSFAMAEELGFSAERATGIQFGAMIHDIGRMSIPVDILNKPGPLNSIEFEMVKSHAEVGQRIVSEIDYPWPVAEIIGQHHERLDGSGYPNGLRGDEISEEARIVAVADVVEAMSSHRPYRAALGVEAALAEISDNRGTLYDAGAVDACLALFRDHQFEFDPY